MSTIPDIRFTAEEVEAAICKASFTDFVRRFWHTVPGSAPLRWNWHMDVICQAMQQVAERIFAGKSKLHDAAISIPPGTSKSTLVSILLPAWMWARDPKTRIICASHTSELVLDLAVKSRDVILSEKYQSLFPLQMREDTATKGLYRNEFGGDRLSCTVAGRSPIGFHAHLIIIDDPLDPKKVMSEVEKQAARHFMEDVIPSRKVDKEVTATVLVMQRLGVGDPTDVMLDAAKREDGPPLLHICLPAELTDDVKPRSLRKHYTDGLLDKSRLPESVLKQERSRNAFAYATQYLQKPTLPGGGMFRREKFNRRCRAAPMACKRVMYVDRAGAITPGACFTACVLMARGPDDQVYIEDVVHGRWEPDERNEIIRSHMLKYRRMYAPRYEPKLWVESEGGSSGRDAWKGFARALAGFSVKEDRVTGSKDVRAEPWATAVAGGLVLLVDGGESEGLGRCSWDIEGFVTEHERFKPDVTQKRLGGFKDIVDACCLLAGTMIDTEFGRLPIEEVRRGDMVWTAAGLRPVTWAGVTGEASSFVEVEFDTGHVLSATLGHLVWTQNRGYTTIESLTPLDRVLVTESHAWRRDRWNGKARRRSTPSSSMGWTTTSGLAAPTTGAGANRSTRQCGSSTTEASPTAMRYTTRTKTRRTTTSTIWSASPTGSMLLGILNAASRRSNSPTWNLSGRRPLPGTAARRGSSGIDSTASGRWLPAGSCASTSASSVPWSFSLTASARRQVLSGSVHRSAATTGSTATGSGRQSRSSVRTAARISSGSLVRSSALRAALPVLGRPQGVPVYDLTVEGEHQFFADGVLVHNSGAYNVLFSTRKVKDVLRSYDIGQRKGQLNVIACTQDDLPELVADQASLLVLLDHPGEGQYLPDHALRRLIARHHLHSRDADLYDPDCRDDPRLGGLKPEDVCLSREEARRCWAFLLRRHDPPPELVVFVAKDEDDRRASSLAMAYCDTLRLPREKSLLVVGGPEKVSKEDAPPNRHCYEVFRSGRAGL